MLLDFSIEPASDTLTDSSGEKRGNQVMLVSSLSLKVDLLGNVGPDDIFALQLVLQVESLTDHRTR